jgi:hypothetical protein
MSAWHLKGAFWHQHTQTPIANCPSDFASGAFVLHMGMTRKVSGEFQVRALGASPLLPNEYLRAR